MEKRLEWKVGVFVLLGLGLAAALLASFSKGVTWLRPTYTILLHADNIAGLQPNSQVLMAGVKVGSVGRIDLAPDGRNVTLSLLIDRRFSIPRNSRFTFEQAGFLGDQYVAVEPMGDDADPLEDLEHAYAERPFNLQEAARNATGLLQRLDEVVMRVDEALQQVRQSLLNPTTLTNLAATAANLRVLSDRATATLGNVDALIVSNTPSIAVAGSNLMMFSEQMAVFSTNLNGLILTNEAEVRRSVQNIEASTESLKSLLREVEAGKGLVGALMKDEELPRNVVEITHNLSITTSNLNRRGLWGILWRPKPEPEPAPRREPLRSPRDQAR